MIHLFLPVSLINHLCIQPCSLPIQPFPKKYSTCPDTCIFIQLPFSVSYTFNRCVLSPPRSTRCKASSGSLWVPLCVRAQWCQLWDQGLWVCMCAVPASGVGLWSWQLMPPGVSNWKWGLRAATQQTEHLSTGAGGIHLVHKYIPIYILFISRLLSCSPR